MVIVKVSEKSENVGVTKVALNLDFSSQLMLDLSFDQLLLVEDLQTDNIFGAFLTCKIDTTIFAFAKWLSDFEIVERPCARRIHVKGATAVRIGDLANDGGGSGDGGGCGCAS